MNTGRKLYVECCQRYGVKPNVDIEAQINSVDFLHLRVLDASHTFLGRLGAFAVLAFVRQHQNVEEVRLPQNCVDDTCMELLACIVAEGHPSLRSVDVSGNPLSTPALRRIWAAARRNSRFTHLSLDGCGVPEEWVTRMDSTLRANEAMERLGYVAHGIPRSPLSWHTVFLLTLGTPEAIQEYCNECLPMVNTFVAGMRVRVAALSLSESDTAEQVEWKFARCQDPFNHQLTWCVVILGAEPLLKRQQYVLEKVLRQKAPARLPLRDKTGELRPPTYRAVRACFCYTPVSWEMSNKASDVVQPAQWLRSAGYSNTSSYDSLLATVDITAVVLTPGNRAARWQSDLFASLSVVFKEDETAERSVSGLGADELLSQEGPKLFYTSVDEVNTMRRFVYGGRFHPKKSTLVFNYACGPYRDSGPPLILYGAGSIGKGHLICNAASMLLEGHVCEGGERPARVVCYTVDVHHNSVVVFLYRLLHLFYPESPLEFASVQSLAEAVRDAIRAYKGPTLALLLGRIDRLDTCGCHCSVIAAWMPNILPRAVRIVVSLNTDSQVLPLLRKRMPQPFECLCPPMTELNCVRVFSLFLKERNIVLPGMENRELKSREGLGIAEKTYLQKEGAMTVLYPYLASAYVQFLLVAGGHLDSEFETNQLIETALPPTVRELIQALHDKAAMLHPVVTVEVLLVVVALAPLPASELVFLCEELGPCPRQTALSTLLLLTDMGLIAWYQDATAHVAHPALRDFFLELYAPRVAELSVLLESHLFRLVITDSEEVPRATWYLIPLMLGNGSMRQVAQLLRNPILMDAFLRRGPMFRLYALDAFIRLLQARRLLCEVAAVGGPPVPAVMAESPLISCLHEVADYTSDLYQTALLRRSSSPYAAAVASTYTVSPQLLIRPLNNGQESTAVATAHVVDPCLWCHCRGSHVVAATNDSVFVYNSELGKPIAELHMPFERQQRIIGVLLAAGSRVLVASETQVLVWDYKGNSHFLFADLKMKMRPSDLDAFGSLLIAANASTDQLCLIDVLKRRIMREMPDMEEGVRQSGIFCGDHLLLISRCSLCLFDEGMKECVTFTHDNIVSAVSSNRDGRILVSYAGEHLYVWTSAGDLLHRLDVGPDPVVLLRMSASGVHFVTHQGSTLQLWKTLTGTPCCTLLNPFKGDVDLEYFVFTEDSAKVVGRAGPYVLVWDAYKGHLIGAESVPTGLITHVAVNGPNVYATTTTGKVHMWSFERGLSSVDQVKEGRCTTNFVVNGKVSRQAIVHVSTNHAGTLLVTVDASRQVRLYSLVTGAPIEHSIRHVKDAIAVGANLVAFLPDGTQTLCFCSLGGNSQLITRELPKDSQPEAEYGMFVSPDEHFIAVTHHYFHHSRAFIYETESSESTWCQLLGHAGRILDVNFFGSFAFTVGEKDKSVKLWSLARKAERTSYTHHCPLVAATGNGAGLLFCLDAEGSVVRLHVDNIVSAKHATLVVSNLSLRAALPSILESGVVQLRCHGSYLILVRDNGELLVVDTQRDDVGHRVAFRDCRCAFVTSVKDAPVLLTGHRSGLVLLSAMASTEANLKRRV
jgi:WD40 repeat protein